MASAQPEEKKGKDSEGGGPLRLDNAALTVDHHSKGHAVAFHKAAAVVSPSTVKYRTTRSTVFAGSSFTAPVFAAGPCLVSRVATPPRPFPLRRFHVGELAMEACEDGARGAL